MHTGGAFLRLPRHHRCFYYTPDSDGAITRGVIAIKGTEPFVRDVDDWLDEMQNALVDPDPSTQWRRAEHFALLEHKVPGALTLREAESEAQIAADIQERHLRAYGSLAQLPLPLIIHRLPEDRLRGFHEGLRRRLSRRAMARIKDSLAHGLAAYLYYYPNVPVRVVQVDLMLPVGNYHERLQELVRLVDPGHVMERWVKGFARMLLLGYLPAALGSRGSGNCCSLMNAVVDGGFVDLDSLIPIAELEDDVLFEETLHYSFSSLYRTVRTFLVGQQGRWSPDRDLIEKWISDHLASSCQQALESEMRPGLVLDPRISEYFAQSLSFRALLDRLERYHPKRLPDHRAQFDRFERYFPQRADSPNSSA
jgi:hypothetical protein